jgi:hypothetical protein
MEIADMWAKTGRKIVLRAMEIALIEALKI